MPGATPKPRSAIETHANGEILAEFDLLSKGITDAQRPTFIAMKDLMEELFCAWKIRGTPRRGCIA